VTIQESTPDTTLKVQVMNPVTTVQTHSVRQAWEYQQITVGPQNAAALLAAAGADGWEATGLQLPSTAGTVVVLKRPR
jgi:hypothetical protein